MHRLTLMGILGEEIDRRIFSIERLRNWWLSSSVFEVLKLNDCDEKELEETEIGEDVVWVAPRMLVFGVRSFDELSWKNSSCSRSISFVSSHSADFSVSVCARFICSVPADSVCCETFAVLRFVPRPISKCLRYSTIRLLCDLFSSTDSSTVYVAFDCFDFFATDTASTDFSPFFKFYLFIIIYWIWFLSGINIISFW